MTHFKKGIQDGLDRKIDKDLLRNVPYMQGYLKAVLWIEKYQDAKFQHDLMVWNSDRQYKLNYIF